MYESSNSLDLEEEFDDKNPKGESFWEIKVPDDLKIDFQSATGSFIMSGIKVDLEGSSGTGNLEVENCSGIFDMNSGTGMVTMKSSKGEFKLNSGTGNVVSISSSGDFDLNSGTGDVKLNDVKGEFSLNSGTGDVEADGIAVDRRSKFNSGTGDVYILLNNNPNDDIELSSGTGSAVLNMNGLPLKGLYVFKTKADDGRIICPVDFDEEEEYWRNGELYEIKSFVKGTDSPEIKISTGTGTAELSLK
ncbi:MAG: hypothetical protein A2V66_07145 [Ignavibacteria bacterium RBG_13_36_8]|nr:MAG: hypothetical protein A2V66_07145 [Ignavibacteria bacterium RBG_13_36_8]